MNEHQPLQSGFVLVDKPVDWTSHDVVAYLRGSLKTKKIGHAGTLDPFATGLLIVGVGRAATKRLDEFKNLQKTYTTTVTLGATSDTYDVTGTITPSPSQKTPTNAEIIKAVTSFLGKQKQIPPMYSAKKIKGKKLYELARKGIEIERQPNDIEIFDITTDSIDYPDVSLSITCSTGTYIRSIAHDLGEQLGVGGYCKALRRASIGTFSAENAKDPKQISHSDITELSI